MKQNEHPSLSALLGLALLLGLCASGNAASNSAFTYQGRLSADGGAANGPYDFEFRLFAAETNGAALAGPVSAAFVPVSNGLFQATIDFGPGAFNGESRWLEISVKNSFTDDLPHLLSPRQPLTATPYALHAANAGGLMSFANAPLDIKINGERVMRYEPATSTTLGFTPNIIGGFGGNYADSGVIGSTVSGGGTLEAPNRIIRATAHNEPQPPEFAVIGGGLGNNIVGASYVTIGGGANNFVSQPMWVLPSTPKFHSVIAGGASNVMTAASMSTISGGAFNRMNGDLGNDIRGATIGGGIANLVDTITVNPTFATGDGNRRFSGDPET